MTPLMWAAFFTGWWLLIAVGAYRVQLEVVLEHPREMPRGGRRALWVRSVLWPLIAVLLAAALCAWAVHGPRERREHRRRVA